VILYFVNEKWPLSGLFSGDKGVIPAAAASGSPEFDSITSKLDKEGDLFVYLNTSKLMGTINNAFATLKETVTSEGKLSEAQKEEADKWFSFLQGILNDSGLLKISGMGISSKEIESGLTRSRVVMQHDPGAGDGLLWNLGRKDSGDLGLLDSLPEETVFASFSDTSYYTIWNWLKKHAEKAGDEKIRFALTSLEKDLKAKGIDLNSLLESMNGKAGIVVTLDRSKIKEYPAPHKKVKFPEPGFALVIETANDSIFSLLSKFIPDVSVMEEKGNKMIDIKVPPMPFTFSPRIVQSGKILILSSNPGLAQRILNGSGDTIRKSKDFQKLSRGMPDTGTGFTYLSPVFFREFFKFQKEMNPGDSESQNKGMEIIKKMGMDFDNLSMFRIAQKTGEGYLITTNTTMNMEMMIIMPAMAAGGIIAAVAIPQIIKKRVKSISPGARQQTQPSREM